VTGYQLAQFNIGRMAGPLDGPVMADFVAGLPAINALAEATPGFVWRLTDERGENATGLRPLDPDIIVNMSVWESVEALRGFTYRTRHLEFMRRRREWFTSFGSSFLVLWWVPAGHIPTIEEALDRLARLDKDGPGPEAFTFREPYPAPDPQG
jgi:hypothetical protein